jgi:hypothetical protein
MSFVVPVLTKMVEIPEIPVIFVIPDRLAALIPEIPDLPTPPTGKCLTRSVISVKRAAKFPSSPLATNRFSAKIVFPKSQTPKAQVLTSLK